MTERPILFSAPMIRAIPDGRKTMTRRVMKPQPHCHKDGTLSFIRSHGDLIHVREDQLADFWDLPCPYGQPGDKLYVKEAAWAFCERIPNGITETGRQKWRYAPLVDAPMVYCADNPTKPTKEIKHPETGNDWGWRYKVARFMQRWASRITLEVTAVRVERLQDISREDAMAEGIDCPTEIGVPCNRCGTCADSDTSVPIRYQCNPRSAFADLWQSLNAKRPGCSWEENPLVWVIAFEAAPERVC